MKYDFDHPIDRTGTNSAKWDYIKKNVGVEDALPMWLADMDFETLPEIREAIIKRANHAVYGYTVRPDSYYDSIIDWNLRRHKWLVKRDWISHSAGVVNALYMALKAFTKPGDAAAIQPPVYHPFYRVIKQSGCRIVLNPLVDRAGRYGFDLADLERKIDDENVKILILCNPHNPVGSVFTADELLNLGELCIKKSVIVVSDEVHSDLVFSQFKHVPFASVSERLASSSVVCTAPSKTFNLAGLSTSNIIIPNPDLKAKYDAANEGAGNKAYNLFGAVACEAAYTHGEVWLDQVLDYIEENKRYVSKFLLERIPECKVNDPAGTYFLWLDCRGLGLSPEALERFMVVEAKLWFNQGYIFGPEGAGFQRVNIACSRATIEEAMRRLERAVRTGLSRRKRRETAVGDGLPLSSGHP